MKKFFPLLLTVLLVISMISAVKAGTCSYENEFCGGIAGIICCEGLTCQLKGSYPDASGTCVKEATKLIITDTFKALPFGLLNQEYSASVPASGGSDSYAWSITSGSLPLGLVIQNAVCIKAPCQVPAIISGKPTAAGFYSFTITVKSGKESASKDYQMTVADTPYIQILNLPAYLKGMEVFGQSPIDVSGVAYACCRPSLRGIAELTVNGVKPYKSWQIEYFQEPGPRDPMIGFVAQVPLQPGVNSVKAVVKDVYGQTASANSSAGLMSVHIISPENGAIVNSNFITVVVKAIFAGEVYVNGVRAYPQLGGDGTVWEAKDVSLILGENKITAVGTTRNPSSEEPVNVEESITVTFLQCTNENDCELTTTCASTADNCCFGEDDGACDPDCDEESDPDCVECTPESGDCCKRSSDGICDLDCSEGRDPDCKKVSCDNDGLCDLNEKENSDNCPGDCYCGDGICDKVEDSKKCQKDCGACTPEFECRLEPAECPEEGLQNKVCYDVKCGTEEKRAEVLKCVPGTCSGCSLKEKCYPVTTRLLSDETPSYCDVTKSFSSQKDLEAPCQNNYECKTNECSSGACTDLKKELEETRSLLNKVLEWLKRLF